MDADKVHPCTCGLCQPNLGKDDNYDDEATRKVVLNKWPVKRTEDAKKAAPVAKPVLVTG